MKALLPSQSPQKDFLLGELAEAKRSLAQKDEEMRHLVKILQRLEEAQERLPRGRRWDQRRSRLESASI